GVEAVVLETARGGILLRGIGTTYNDVAVVTNVSADHLGLHGIETLDQLAEVKSTILRITRPEGWDVLNADDPRVLAMRRVGRGPGDRAARQGRHEGPPVVRARSGDEPGPGEPVRDRRPRRGRRLRPQRGRHARARRGGPGPVSPGPRGLARLLVGGRPER